MTGTYLWKNCGYTSILWTAGLEAIPVDQYEAARVDGAGTWQQFWHITWPELQPTLALTLILSLLNAFKVFREAYLVAGRYPQQKHLSVAAFVQQLVFKSGPAAPCCCRRVGCAGVVGCDFGIIEMVGPLCER